MFMARAANRTVIEGYYNELWIKRNFALVDQISFRGSLGIEVRGRAAFRDYTRRIQNTFPDFHNRVEELVSENDREVARLTYTGTHHGEILVMAGRRISYAGAASESRIPRSPRAGLSAIWTDCVTSSGPKPQVCQVM
jgi:predicted ester cyclase